MDLKAELQKVKDAARVAREATEAAETTSYERGVLDMMMRLAEEVAGVCKDYCTEVWTEALNRAGVPATSKLRSAKNIFFPEDIQEVPTTLPLPLFFLPFPPFEQLPPSKPLLLMLKSQQGLARVKRMSRGVLSPRIRARTRRSSH